MGWTKESYDLKCTVIPLFWRWLISADILQLINILKSCEKLMLISDCFLHLWISLYNLRSNLFKKQKQNILNKSEISRIGIGYLKLTHTDYGNKSSHFNEVRLTKRIKLCGEACPRNKGLLTPTSTHFKFQFQELVSIASKVPEYLYMFHRYAYILHS